MRSIEHDRRLEVDHLDIPPAVTLGVRAVDALRDHGRCYARERRSQLQDGLLHLGLGARDLDCRAHLVCGGVGRVRADTWRGRAGGKVRTLVGDGGVVGMRVWRVWREER